MPRSIASCLFSHDPMQNPKILQEKLTLVFKAALQFAKRRSPGDPGLLSLKETSGTLVQATRLPFPRNGFRLMVELSISFSPATTVFRCVVPSLFSPVISEDS